MVRKHFALPCTEPDINRAMRGLAQIRLPIIRARP